MTPGAMDPERVLRALNQAGLHAFENANVLRHIVTALCTEHNRACAERETALLARGASSEVLERASVVCAQAAIDVASSETGVDLRDAVVDAARRLRGYFAAALPSVSTELRQAMDALDASEQQ